MTADEMDQAIRKSMTMQFAAVQKLTDPSRSRWSKIRMRQWRSESRSNPTKSNLTKLPRMD
jgi:hypothetical protein